MLKGKLLAIDVGESRVGFALTDELQIISFPYCFVERFEAVEKIKEIISKEGIGGILVGLPLLQSGERGSQTIDVDRFVEELRNHVDIEIDFENEILTSVEAEERLNNSRKPYSKGDIDAMSACIFLENYIGRK